MGTGEITCRTCVSIRGGYVWNGCGLPKSNLRIVLLHPQRRAFSRETNICTGPEKGPVGRGVKHSGDTVTAYVQLLWTSPDVQKSFLGVLVLYPNALCSVPSPVALFIPRLGYPDSIRGQQIRLCFSRSRAGCGFYTKNTL